ncbi:serine hydrolase domain-containing protein [Streptomyces sp. NEAU-Y11]|uniref:serine hydrolase domain-containing protein n=1 Tax=Streptomyces cucumeris TaxID=2962890 RepID=UPI0020C87CBB|nr:serine hydrolase domain-containing protein [Streptomyces sp. NEAU-Y11]MCP9206337.1 beta-lactamase family protein [Streptomyces sp. NEAU-Y11]
MGAGGWSTARLDRMRDVLARHVAEGEAPGLVTLVSRRGETRAEVIGAQAFGGAPMRRDTVFRISSMTKPVIAVATMILVEECVLRLDDPVDPLLPELADRRVLIREDGPLEETVPAERPLTVRDLLTFRMGFGLAPGPPGGHPALAAAEELGLAMGPPKPATPHGPDEWLRRFGTLPLMRQPGTAWLYHTGSQVLGVLIARATGRPLEDFLQERIFEPLGMKDTGFHVPPGARDRFAASYLPDLTTGEPTLYDAPGDGRWSRPPVFPDGGAGLVSTADDYLAFGRMLLAGGRYGAGARLLSRPAVEAMTTDQLTPAQKAASTAAPGSWDHRGWGFGVQVVTGRDGISAVPGRFGWDGGLGTSWASDPAEDLVAVLMTQRAQFPRYSPLYLDFWTLVYQAIDD